MSNINQWQSTTSPRRDIDDFQLLTAHQPQHFFSNWSFNDQYASMANRFGMPMNNNNNNTSVPVNVVVHSKRSEKQQHADDVNNSKHHETCHQTKSATSSAAGGGGRTKRATTMQNENNRHNNNNNNNIFESDMVMIHSHQLHEMKQQIENLVEKIVDLETKNAHLPKLKEKILQLKTEKVELVEKLNSAQLSNNEYANKIVDLNQRLDKLKAAFAKMQTNGNQTLSEIWMMEHAELKIKLQNVLNESEIIKFENKQLFGQLSQQRHHHIPRLNNRIQELEKYIAQLESALDAADAQDDEPDEEEITEEVTSVSKTGGSTDQTSKSIEEKKSANEKQELRQEFVSESEEKQEFAMIAIAAEAQNHREVVYIHEGAAAMEAAVAAAAAAIVKVETATIACNTDPMTVADEIDTISPQVLEQLQEEAKNRAIKNYLKEKRGNYRGKITQTSDLEEKSNITTTSSNIATRSNQQDDSEQTMNLSTEDKDTQTDPEEKTPRPEENDLRLRTNADPLNAFNKPAAEPLPSVLPSAFPSASAPTPTPASINAPTPMYAAPPTMPTPTPVPVPIPVATTTPTPPTKPEMKNVSVEMLPILEDVETDTLDDYEGSNDFNSLINDDLYPGEMITPALVNDYHQVTEWFEKKETLVTEHYKGIIQRLIHLYHSDKGEFISFLMKFLAKDVKSVEIQVLFDVKSTETFIDKSFFVEMIDIGCSNDTVDVRVSPLFSVFSTGVMCKTDSKNQFTNTSKLSNNDMASNTCAVVTLSRKTGTPGTIDYFAPRYVPDPEPEPEPEPPLETVPVAAAVVVKVGGGEGGGVGVSTPVVAAAGISDLTTSTNKQQSGDVRDSIPSDDSQLVENTPWLKQLIEQHVQKALKDQLATLTSRITEQSNENNARDLSLQEKNSFYQMGNPSVRLGTTTTSSSLFINSGSTTGSGDGQISIQPPAAAAAASSSSSSLVVGSNQIISQNQPQQVESTITTQFSTTNVPNDQLTHSVQLPQQQSSISSNRMLSNFAPSPAVAMASSSYTMSSSSAPSTVPMASTNNASYNVSSSMSSSTPSSTPLGATNASYNISSSMSSSSPSTTPLAATNASYSTTTSMSSTTPSANLSASSTTATNPSLSISTAKSFVTQPSANYVAAPTTTNAGSYTTVSSVSSSNLPVEASSKSLSTSSQHQSQGLSSSSSSTFGQVQNLQQKFLSPISAMSSSTSELRKSSIQSSSSSIYRGSGYATESEEGDQFTYEAWEMVYEIKDDCVVEAVETFHNRVEGVKKKHVDSDCDVDDDDDPDLVLSPQALALKEMKKMKHEVKHLDQVDMIEEKGPKRHVNREQNLHLQEFETLLKVIPRTVDETGSTTPTAKKKLF